MVRFVLLMAQVAQVAEIYIWITSKIYLNNFETISGYDTQYLKNVGTLPCSNVYFCHLYHLCHKWHKFNNDRNSAENSVNALKLKSR